jgi:hypothetical protein
MVNEVAAMGQPSPQAPIQCRLTDPEPEANGLEECVGAIDIANAAKISKMVLLAPNIVEAIVERRAEDRVMLKVLEGMLPVDWEVQSRELERKAAPCRKCAWDRVVPGMHMPSCLSCEATETLRGSSSVQLEDDGAM